MLVDLHFQGIIMSGDSIYTLHGDFQAHTKKVLSKYSLKDEKKLNSTIISPSNNQDLTQWELEGLFFVNGGLYTTLNTTTKAGLKNKTIYKLAK